ncbi:MAG: NHL repeat-containing protein, partial [Candidatus Zixiibacteriota bacterium]
MGKWILFYLLLFFVIFVSCSDEEAANDYSITVKGHIEGVFTSFDGQYARMQDSLIWDNYDVESDSTVLDIPKTGTYLLKASKAGYRSFPVIDTVTISDMATSKRSIFTFYESAGGDSSYTIEVNGFYEGNPVSFQCRYQSDSIWHSLPIGSAGSAIISFENPCTVLLAAIKEGYSVYPEIDTVELSIIQRHQISNFEFSREDSSSRFRIHIIGQSEGRRLPFSASYRHDSLWNDIEVGESGSMALEVEDTGSYYIVASKEGYITSPEVDTVVISETVPEHYAVFEFIDTIGPPIIDIIGELYGTPTSFDAQYCHESGICDSASIGSSGMISIEVDSFGEYVISARKPGFAAEPEYDTVLLSMESPSATASFSFSDSSSSGPYYLTFIGQSDGGGIAFTGLYKMPHEADWSELSVGTSGNRTVEIPYGSKYYAKVERTGYLSWPVIDSVIFSAENVSETVHFELIDTAATEPEYTISCIGEIDGSRTNFTAYYCLDGMPWEFSNIETGSRDLHFYLPGDYLVYARKAGHRSIPEMDTITLSEEMSYGYASFEFVDTMEIPTYVLLISGTHLREPMAFTAEYRSVSPGAPWHSVEIGDLGETAIHLETPGDYQIRPIIDPPYESTIDMATVTFEPTDTEKRVNFRFIDTTRFYEPTKILIADWDNNRIIQMDDISGTGWEVLEGFNRPVGIAVDRLHRIYICDEYHHRIVRVDDITGANPVYFGSSGSGVGEFDAPVFIRVDEIGRIYISDHGNRRVVRIDDMSGAGWIELSGDGAGDNFVGQYGIDIDRTERVYIADWAADRIIRVDDMTGAGWTSFGTTGSGVGEFNDPHNVRINLDGEILICDEDNSRIVQISDIDGSSWAEYDLTTSPPRALNVDGYKRIYIGRETGYTRIDDISGRNRVDYGVSGS